MRERALPTSVKCNFEKIESKLQDNFEDKQITFKQINYIKVYLK